MPGFKFYHFPASQAPPSRQFGVLFLHSEGSQHSCTFTPGLLMILTGQTVISNFSSFSSTRSADAYLLVDTWYTVHVKFTTFYTSALKGVKTVPWATNLLSLVLDQACALCFASCTCLSNCLSTCWGWGAPGSPRFALYFYNSVACTHALEFPQKAQ